MLRVSSKRLPFQHFSRHVRLFQPSEFKSVFQTGRKSSSRYFALYVKKNNLSYARLGVVVAKRNVRKATLRNLIKRIVRESFRLHSVRQISCDIVVVIYKPYSLLSRQEMRDAIDGKWKVLFSSVQDKN